MASIAKRSARVAKRGSGVTVFDAVPASVDSIGLPSSPSLSPSIPFTTCLLDSDLRLAIWFDYNWHGSRCWGWRDWDWGVGEVRWIAVPTLTGGVTVAVEVEEEGRNWKGGESETSSYGGSKSDHYG